jgi:hypothetical protein
VPHESACLPGSPDRALEVNHPMLNKYRGPDDENFKTVSNCLKNFVAGAKQTLEGRGESRVCRLGLAQLLTNYRIKTLLHQRTLCPSSQSKYKIHRARTYAESRARRTGARRAARRKERVCDHGHWRHWQKRSLFEICNRCKRQVSKFHCCRNVLT